MVHVASIPSHWTRLRGRNLLRCQLKIFLASDELGQFNELRARIIFCLVPEFETGKIFSLPNFAPSYQVRLSSSPSIKLPVNIFLKFTPLIFGKASILGDVDIVQRLERERFCPTQGHESRWQWKG
jgi:hypothetical protein